MIKQYVASHKYDRLQEMSKDLQELAAKEKAHYYDATHYLKEQRDFDYDLINEVESHIYDREDLIVDYAVDKRDTLQDTVTEKRDQIQDQVLNRRDEEQDQLTD